MNSLEVNQLTSTEFTIFVYIFLYQKTFFTKDGISRKAFKFILCLYIFEHFLVEFNKASTIIFIRANKPVQTYILMLIGLEKDTLTNSLHNTLIRWRVLVKNLGIKDTLENLR